MAVETKPVRSTLPRDNKLEHLQRRGVDVVEVTVHTDDDLKALFPEEPTVR